ncbi:MAG: cyclic nucleotide-binding domain-containing protein [Sinobacterium sp.]|nr:cyclic nucleotide-binding domain-containing protein [Sinobacterium sp.]
MRIINFNQYTENNADDLLRVSFLRALSEQDQEQYKLLLKQTYIAELDANENLLEQGSEHLEFYAVVSGRLEVLAKDKVVGHVSAGQLLGFFSLLNGTPRSATLRASGLNGAKIISINFRLFGNLEDFSFFTLASKLCLYKEVEKFARWKLDAYVALSEDRMMQTLLSDLKVFDGSRGSLQELVYLDKQVKQLSQLFTKMNDSFRT